MPNIAYSSSPKQWNISRWLFSGMMLKMDDLEEVVKE
jgi:hypothetical protein